MSKLSRKSKRAVILSFWSVFSIMGVPPVLRRLTLSEMSLSTASTWSELDQLEMMARVLMILLGSVPMYLMAVRVMNTSVLPESAAH